MVAFRLDHNERNRLEIKLYPLYDEVTNCLGGFHLLLSGEVDITLPLPPELNRADLGESMTIPIIAANYSVPRHCLMTCFKSAQALVEQGLLSSSTVTPSSSKET